MTKKFFTTGVLTAIEWADWCNYMFNGCTATLLGDQEVG